MIDQYNTDALMYITDRPPLVMVRGQGSWLWDHQGKAYLDFVQGWAVNALGHSPAVVIQALQEQAAQLINPSPAYYNAPMIELANLITCTSKMDRVFFTNSGAEANEGAIKLARKWGQLHRQNAYEIITLDHAFHGRTLATMSASGKAQWEQLYEPKVAGFPKVPINNLAAVKAAITEKTVGIMLEPIQGEAGVYPADDAYLRGLRQLADEANILLIIDEVQTGMGRTGTMFAFQHADILPDIMTLGKGIGGGVPLAALVAREAVCCFAAGDQGGTYNGNPLMTAVGCSVTREISSQGFLAKVVTTGQYLSSQLALLSARYHLGEIRGRGLLLALDLTHDIAKDVVSKAMEMGLLINAPAPATLRFMPSLVVSHEEIDQMISMLDSILSDCLAP